MNLVPHNHDFARDQCIKAAFALLDTPTDWDSVIANAHTLHVDDLTAELKAGEPYDDNEVNRLKIFRLQTRIRIGLRNTKGRSQYASYLCGRCGTRRADPVLSESWRATCLCCAEHDLLMGANHRPYHSYYSSWHVGFDPASKTWGIAYESAGENHRDERMVAFVVTGYDSHDHAMLDCTAPDRFANVFNSICAAGLEIDAGEIRPIGELFKLQLPLGPVGWRDFLVEHMRSATPGEATPYEHNIESSIRSYFRKRH